MVERQGAEKHRMVVVGDQIGLPRGKMTIPNIRNYLLLFDHSILPL